MKARAVVVEVNLTLSVDEVRELCGLLYSTTCNGEQVSLSGLRPDGRPGSYSLVPSDGFDRKLFNTLLHAIPVIGEDA